MLKERHAVSEDAFVEMVVWRLSSPETGGQQQGFKYRLAFVVKPGSGSTSAGSFDQQGQGGRSGAIAAGF